MNLTGINLSGASLAAHPCTPRISANATFAAQTERRKPR
jgi:hypothetical protein